MNPPSVSDYRWPAEWEPHAATWLSWPHNEASWPGRFETVEPAYAAMVRALAESEPVWINVCDQEMEDRARRFLRSAGASGEIAFQHIPTNDAWCRDHGAIFLAESPELERFAAGYSHAEDRSRTRQSLDDPTRDVSKSGDFGYGLNLFENPQGRIALIATDWRYNAWGGKYPHDLDDAVARRMADALGVTRMAHSMVLEGGSIDGNGAGALLTTEACLLHPNRNHDLSRERIEAELRMGLGVREILWLGEGIAGDDTDGHIDDITRFVGERTVVTVIELDAHDENYRPLRENRARLADMAIEGRALEVIELPMPPRIEFEGQRLPASYANFYIANSKILLPGYDNQTDDRARRILAELFPQRDVEIIDCRDLIWGLGAFHCLTQQVPAVIAT